MQNWSLEKSGNAVGRILIGNSPLHGPAYTRAICRIDKIYYLQKVCNTNKFIQSWFLAQWMLFSISTKSFACMIQVRLFRLCAGWLWLNLHHWLMFEHRMTKKSLRTYPVWKAGMPDKKKVWTYRFCQLDLDLPIFFCLQNFICAGSNWAPESSRLTVHI